MAREDTTMLEREISDLEEKLKQRKERLLAVKEEITKEEMQKALVRFVKEFNVRTAADVERIANIVRSAGKTEKPAAAKNNDASADVVNPAEDDKLKVTKTPGKLYKPNPLDSKKVIEKRPVKAVDIFPDHKEIVAEEIFMDEDDREPAEDAGEHDTDADNNVSGNDVSMGEGNDKAGDDSDVDDLTEADIDMSAWDTEEKEDIPEESGVDPVEGDKEEAGDQKDDTAAEDTDDSADDSEFDWKAFDDLW